MAWSSTALVVRALQTSPKYRHTTSGKGVSGMYVTFLCKAYNIFRLASAVIDATVRRGDAPTEHGSPRETNEWCKGAVHVVVIGI